MFRGSQPWLLQVGAQGANNPSHPSNMFSSGLLSIELFLSTHMVVTSLIRHPKVLENRRVIGPLRTAARICPPAHNLVVLLL